MQDYDGPPPPTPYHPLIGEGAWPDHYVNMVVFLVLIAALILGYLAYRAGQRSEKGRHDGHRNKAPEIIFAAVRRQIDIALIATGEKAFGPVKVLVDTIDAYLGPVLALAAGPNSLIGAVGKLKSALNTTKKKVPHDAHEPHGGGSSVIIAGGNGSAVAAAAADGGSVQVVHPARIIEIPAHGSGHGGGHGAHGHDKEVEMTSIERVRAVREALEHLSDVWQRPKVIDDLLAAQTALLITKPIPVPGTAAAAAPGGAPRPAPPRRELRPAPPRPERPRRALF
jgi:hypothetical protein